MAKGILLNNNNNIYIGYFPEGITLEEAVPSKRLLAVTKIIDEIEPFTETIPQMLSHWAEGIKNKELLLSQNKKEESEFDFLKQEFYNNEDRLKTVERVIPALLVCRTFFETEMRTLINNGIAAEEYAVAKLEDKKAEPKDWSGNAIPLNKNIQDGSNGFLKEVEKLGKLKIDEDTFQLALMDSEMNTINKMDFTPLLENGERILVDFKLGSEMKGNKLRKAATQLLGAYYWAFKEHYGKPPAKVLIIHSGKKVVNYNGKKRLIDKSETIDLLEKFDPFQVRKEFRQLKEIYDLKVELGIKVKHK